MMLQTRRPFAHCENTLLNSPCSRRARGDSTPVARPDAVVVAAYNLARFGVGAALTPLRPAQAWSAGGEKIEILARKWKRA